MSYQKVKYSGYYHGSYLNNPFTNEQIEQIKKDIEDNRKQYLTGLPNDIKVFRINVYTTEHEGRYYFHLILRWSYDNKYLLDTERIKRLFNQVLKTDRYLGRYIKLSVFKEIYINEYLERFKIYSLYSSKMKRGRPMGSYKKRAQEFEPVPNNGLEIEEIRGPSVEQINTEHKAEPGPSSSVELIDKQSADQIGEQSAEERSKELERENSIKDFTPYLGKKNNIFSFLDFF